MLLQSDYDEFTRETLKGNYSTFIQVSVRYTVFTSVNTCSASLAEILIYGTFTAEKCHSCELHAHEGVLLARLLCRYMTLLNKSNKSLTFPFRSFPDGQRPKDKVSGFETLFFSKMYHKLSEHDLLEAFYMSLLGN